MTEGFRTEEGETRPRLPEPAEWVGRYGDALYRYALARLRRPDDAEEAVQEALLAALAARGQFRGRSHPLTPRPAAPGALPRPSLVQRGEGAMLSCRHASRMISDGLDRPLVWVERLALGFHLLLCTPCRRFRRAARWLQGILDRPADGVRLPDDARDRLRRALSRAARDG